MSLMDIFNNIQSGLNIDGSDSNVAAAPQAQAGPDPAAAQFAAWGLNPGAGSTPTWNISNGGLTKQEGLNAPVYKDVFTDFGGQTYMTGQDPALSATLGAGGQGKIGQGLGAFLTSAGGNDFNAMGKELSGGSMYDVGQMRSLANQFGIDTSQYGDDNARGLQDYLNNNLKDYLLINGLSEGWNPTGDARQANGTIYKRENGQLVPYQTKGWSAPEKGGWIQEHPGILAPLAVATGGLAYGAMAGGAGAGAGATAATTGAGAGGGGIGGTVANALGLGSQWGALPGYAQGALTGAGMGGVSSGLQGGNILEGMLMGGLTGGLGSGFSSGLQGMGLSSGLSSGLGRLGANTLVGAARGGDMSSLLQNGAIGLGTNYLGGQLGLGGGVPTDNSLGAILTRMAAQQGGSYLAGQIDPRLRGLGGQAGGSLAALFNRY